MKASTLTTLALTSVMALGLSACGSDQDSAESASAPAAEDGSVSGELTGGGASSQESAMTAWTQGVTEVQPDLSVQYDPVGSGAGREGFLNGQYSFAGSDAAMGTEEQEEAEAVCGTEGVFHVPAYISPIAIAFNLDGIEELNLDPATIAQIFTGEITKWDDAAIADANPDVDLPDTEITVVHRADDSGTTENFTDYLASTAEDDWSYGAVETWPGDISAESAQQTSGVVSLASSTDGAITYADASQVGELGVAAVKVGDDYVSLSAEAAAAAVETATPDEEAEGAVTLVRDTDEDGVYPVVLISYHLYCHSYADADLAEQAKAFGSYVISEEGQNAAAESAGNAPISEIIRDEAQSRLDAISVAE